MVTNKEAKSAAPRPRPARLFKKYKAIILALGLFVLLDLSVLGYNFYASTEQGHVKYVSLSSRQRVLSQQIAKSLYALQKDYQDPTKREVNLKELKEAVALFDATQKSFQSGGLVLGTDGISQQFNLTDVLPESKDNIAEARKVWEPYYQKLQPVLEGKATEEQIAIAAKYAEANNMKLLDVAERMTREIDVRITSDAKISGWVQLGGILIALAIFLYAVLMALRKLVEQDQQLELAHQEAEQILLTVKEGLFLLDKEYCIGSQHSASLTGILQRDVQEGDKFLPILQNIVPQNIYNSVKDYIELLFGDRVKEALVLSLNPLSRVEVTFGDTLKTRKTRYLSFQFNRVIVDGKISHLLVTVQDVTEHVNLQQQLEQAKDLVRLEIDALLRLLKGDPARLQQFLASVRTELGTINDSLRVGESNPEVRMNKVNLILRKLHTMKGEAAMLGVEMLETYAHKFEQELIEIRDMGEVSGSDMLRIPVLLDGFYEQLASIDQFIERFTAVQRTQRGVGVVRPEEDSFPDKLQKLAQRIAGDQQKKIQLVTRLDTLEKLPQPLTEEIQSIVIQLLRNAITHGIEDSTQRITQAKSAVGSIQIRCEKLTEDKFKLTVRDDGNGIVLQKIRDKLIASGMMSRETVDKMGEGALIGQIFRPGFSTAAGSDRDAGHGIGLDIVAAKIAKLRGGDLKLSSRPNEFTEFHICFSA